MTTHPPSRLRSPYHDVALCQRYAGEDLIYLSLGETWTGPPPGLLAALGEVAADSHGYSLNPYGLPALHDTLREYIPRTHGLDTVATLGVDYEVSASEGSTRRTMAEFGRLLLEEQAEGPPIAVCSSPGWDYAGVYAPLGFHLREFGIAPESNYQPSVSEFAAIVAGARRDSRGPLLVALNAQHNPTGANWSPDRVREMIRIALDADAHLLVDDAYYAVHDAGVTPTPALRLLLDELRGLRRRPSWIATRSLGKQFGCNGWGVGATTGPPHIIEALRAHLMPQHSYVSATPLQAAMAAWLQNPASDAHLTDQQELYAATRRLVGRALAEDLRYPADAYSLGTCGAYMLLKAPPWYSRRPARDYREQVLARTGVLLGEAFMSTPGRPMRDSNGYLRLYLGQSADRLAEALHRLAHAEFTWTGPKEGTHA